MNELNKQYLVLLGLDEAWLVKSADLSIESKRVVIALERFLKDRSDLCFNANRGRAGTTWDTYQGDLDIRGDANAPLLDSISWYGGNSGHEYDLRKSYSLEHDWLKERQYPEKVGGTRKVSQKTPNAWGLYDMLGNVLEWCQDWYENYPTELTERMIDPIGPAKGTDRVLRGGSWIIPARLLRSACRFRYDPGVRSLNLGFRLLSSAHQAVQATESGEEASQGEIASGGRATSLSEAREFLRVIREVRSEK